MIKKSHLLRSNIIYFFLSFVVTAYLIYIFLPNYSLPPSYFYNSLLSAILSLNSTIALFPSKLVFMFQSSKAVGFIDYLPLFSPFFLGGLILIIWKGKILNMLWYFLNPVIYAVIILTVAQGTLQLFIYPTLLIVFLFLNFSYRDKSLAKYLFLSLIIGLILSFNLWIGFVEKNVYSVPYFSFIPIWVWENIRYLLGLILLLTVVKIRHKLISLSPFIIYILLFFVLHMFTGTVSMNNYGWQAKWIWSFENQKNQYLIFKKDVIIPQFLTQDASVDITAKSAYELYINDHFVGRGPGPIDEKKRFFDHYRISNFLKKGVNSINIITYSFGDDTHFQKKENGGILAQFAFKKGPFKWVLPTNTSWSVQSETGWQPLIAKGDEKHEYGGDVEHSDLYHEIYIFDRTRKVTFTPVETPVKSTDNLFKRDIPYLISNAQTPQQTIIDNEIWFDFGKMTVGYPHYSFSTRTPTTYTISYYEDKNDPPKQQDTLITHSSGNFMYNTFGRRGFRYAKVTSSTHSIDSFRMNIDTVRFPAPQVGSFGSDNINFNQFYQLGKDTLKLGMQDQLEDSFVWERSQYLGDAYIDMLSGFYSWDASILAKKSLYQFASSQRPDGIIETVYPSSLNQTILSYNLLFNQYLKDYFLYTNDKQTVKDLIPNGEKIVIAFEKLKDDSGLITMNNISKIKTGDVLTYWIDHIEGDPLFSQDKGPDVNLVLNILYFDELKSLEYLYQFIKPETAKIYQQKAITFARTLNQVLDHTSLSSLDQHSAVFLINSHLLSQQKSQQLYDQVLRSPHQPFITGYFDYFYLQSAYYMNDTEKIKEILDEQWGGMIRSGAVTTWETYDPRSEKVASQSKTHAWSSGPTSFLPAYVAGIRPGAPGFKKILISPLFVTNSVDTTVQTVCGAIHLTWEKRVTSVSLTVTKTCTSPVLFDLPIDPRNIINATMNGKVIAINKKENTFLYESKENNIKLELSLTE